MTGELEAAGDFATGAIIGRAVEPTAGERPNGSGAHHLCLNCGTALAGDFCHICGQPQHIHKTLSSIGHDVLHGVFHFDGKIWRTLPMLFTRPGALTRRYVAGERARFVSPLALFLFSVFPMVATFETVGGPIGGGGNVTRNDKEMTSEDIAAELTKAEAKLAKLKAQRDALKAQKADTEAIDDQIEDVAGDVTGLKIAKSAKDGKLPDLSESMANGDLKIHSTIPSLDEKLQVAIKNPKLFLYKLQSSAYKFSWMLVPISLPFIWLLFAFRRDVGPYDHAIFAIYSLSAMTLGVVGLSLLRAIGLPGALIGLVLVFGPPLHMYKQLRGAYGLGRFGAAWRTIALLVSATIVTLLFLLFVLGVAA